MTAKTPQAAESERNVAAVLHAVICHRGGNFDRAMSSGDDNDDDDDDEEEESDNEISDEDGDDDEDEDDVKGIDEKLDTAQQKALDILTKDTNAANDIALIQDIFAYIDKTSRRIAQSLIVQEEYQKLLHENDKARDIRKMNDSHDDEHPLLQNYSEGGAADDCESISWSQYENLNDGQRAHLLEQSLQMLGREAKGRSESSHLKRVEKAKSNRNLDQKRSST